MIEAAIFSRLSQDAAVSAVVGSRIYAGFAPQASTIPYVAFTMYTSSVNAAMGANIDIENASFSFTAVSKDYDEARALIKAVKDSLERFTQTTGIEVLHSQILRYTPTIYNKELESYHRGVDVYFDYRPSTV